MKKLKIKALRIAIVVIMLPAALVSCKKDEVVASKVLTEKPDVVSIDVLKEFMAKTGGITVKSIGYNVKTEQFTWQGKDQISKTELLYAYNQSNLK
jgi:hypothetical protein